jgi:hypothetical protein
MSGAIKWIKFSNRVINPAHISKIDVSPEKIIIYVASTKLYGSSLFGSGGIESHETTFVVESEGETAGGYKLVKRWIEELP